MFMSLSTLHNSCYNYITRLVSGNIYASIQNTKYALLSLAEFVEIYALFGRTKQTQNLCAEDQIQFLGLGKCVLLFCFDYSFPRYIGKLEMCGSEIGT